MKYKHYAEIVTEPLKILSKHQPTTVGLISPEELLGDHGINRIKALRLGVEGKLRFYIFIKYATIVFGDFIEASEDGGEYLDPKYCFDVGKGFFFQVAPATLEEMLQSPGGENKGNVQLIFPDALKGKTRAWKPDAPDVTYKNRIQGGFYRPYGPSGTLKVAGDKYLDGQMGRKIENLCILKEDVAAYTRGINSNEPLAPEQAPVVPGDLISLTAASMMAGKSREELLEDVANGGLEAFTSFLTAKVEYGSFPIQPAPSNLGLDWPAGESRPYAIALPPVVVNEFRHRLEEINVDSYEYPQMVPLKLDTVHVGMIRTGESATIEYGFLPDGRAFKVVDPIDGLKVTIDGLFVRKSDLEHDDPVPPSTIERLPAGGQDAVLAQDHNDPIYWSWRRMMEFSKLDRKTIGNRAGWLNIEFLERRPKRGHKPEKGLRKSDLSRIKKY